MNEEQIEIAAKMWADGVRKVDIAAHLGVTQHMIRGMAERHRDRFPARENADYTVAGRSALNITDRIKAKTTGPVRFPPKAPGDDGVVSGRLTSCHCAFPLWGDHERFDYKTSLYCGAPAPGKAPYCGFHANLTAGRGTASEREAHRVLKRAAS